MGGRRGAVRLKDGGREGRLGRMRAVDGWGVRVRRRTGDRRRGSIVGFGYFLILVGFSKEVIRFGYLVLERMVDAEKRSLAVMYLCATSIIGCCDFHPPKNGGV